MKALDIAIFLFTVNLALYVTSAALGVISAGEPTALFSASDINALLVYSPGASPTDIAVKLMQVFIVPAISFILMYKVAGIDATTAIFVSVGLGVGLFFFGRVLYYTVMIGSLYADLLYSLLGITVPYAVVYSLNALGVAVAMLALVDWWRGASSRQMG